ncbi:MAG: hypothetical protein IJ575_07830 [Selenomonadaceae bacterium]|nr:hypothetical protein [Selenomonadaceae bacterium]
MQKFMLGILAAIFMIFSMNHSDAANLRSLQLGTSQFSVMIPTDFVAGEMTQEEMDDDMVGYFYSENELMDFDVYQFSKDGEPRKLYDYAKKEAEEFKADVVRDKINGIKVAYYVANEMHDKKMYPTLTYIFDSKDEYVEIVFWLDGDEATQQAMNIINTLKKN